MKKVLLSLIGIIACISLFAQAPNAFKYQAVLRNADGTIMAEENVTIVISVLKSDLITSVFEETHTTKTSSLGLINLNIGSIEDLSGIDWSADNYFIEISVNGTILGTSQLLSVPYALHSKTADSIARGISDIETDPVYSTWNKSYNDLINTPVIIDSITAVIDTTTQFIRTEVDGDVTNEIQNLSEVLGKSNDGGATQIKNIADPTDNQDAATKLYIDQMKAEIFTQIAGGKVTDYDGNSYNIVKIGDQIWMAENLKTTHYANGAEIELVYNYSSWDALSYTDKAMCYYDTISTNAVTYGALYTWAAAMNGSASSSSNPSGIQGACPDGWHLPSDAEWTILTTYLGGESDAGGKLKETGTTHWTTPNTGATNESGFTALPGGYRYGSGTFKSIDFSSCWWSATESSAKVYFRVLYHDLSSIGRYCDYKEYGFYVRCLRD